MFPVAMVRLLKGAPLACLVALMTAQQEGLGAQGAGWLERATGYTDKPVYHALVFLEEQGLVSRNGRYLWQLVGELKQLPFSARVSDESPPLPRAGPHGVVIITRVGNIPPPAHNRVGNIPPPASNRVVNIPTPASSGGSRTIESSNKSISTTTTTTRVNESEKFRLPASPQDGECDAPQVGGCRADVLKALDAAGIREPARSRLSPKGSAKRGRGWTL